MKQIESQCSSDRSSSSSIIRERAPLIVLDALLRGERVKLPIVDSMSYDVEIGEEVGTDRTRLCIVMRGPDGDERHVVPDLDVGDFVDACKRLHEDELVIMSANKVLNDISGAQRGA